MPSLLQINAKGILRVNDNDRPYALRFSHPMGDGTWKTFADLLASPSQFACLKDLERHISMGPS